MIIRIFSILLTINKWKICTIIILTISIQIYFMNSATNWINVNPEVSADVHKYIQIDLSLV